MINKGEGKILKDAVKAGHNVILKSSLEIASYTNSSSDNDTMVPYQLWYSGIYDFDYEDFDLNEIEDVYKQLSFFKEKSKSYFEPRIFTFSCEKEGSCSQNLIDESCISNGKYCVMFP